MMKEEPSQSLLMLVGINSEWYVVYGACIEFVSSFGAGSLYCMRAARSVSAGDGRRINDDFNSTLYIAWALRVISPLERELFISAERQEFCSLQRRHVLIKLSSELSS
jgi:hypothetical protein